MVQLDMQICISLRFSNYKSLFLPVFFVARPHRFISSVTTLQNSLFFCPSML